MEPREPFDEEIPIFDEIDGDWIEEEDDDDLAYALNLKRRAIEEEQDEGQAREDLL